ncbi:hypothetical protein [Klebsiella michiganensis]|uniref:hypothetical protein n=1 Tax=Klebsiella michiganensis TaxID=1134687 RepID=UPI003F50CD6A
MDEMQKVAVLFHCVFGNGEITEFSHVCKYEDYSYPYLYAVFLCSSEQDKRTVAGGIIIRTTAHHTDEHFFSVVEAACRHAKELLPFLNSEYRLQPSLLRVDGNKPLTAMDYKTLMVEKYLQFSVSGLVN